MKNYTARIKRGLKWAEEASFNSTFHQHHLGAALVYKGCLLTKGFNSNKTSPLQRELNEEREFDIDRWPSTIHAEVHCLNKVKDLDIDFSKATLYISRHYKNGKPAIASPCPACREMIRRLGIKDIVYTSDTGWIHERIEE